jgi:peptidase S51-like protein
MRLSYDSEVARIINEAGGIFLPGGNQSRYVRYWQDTRVQAALNRHIEMGKPLGGISAGMAILREFSFTAMIDTINTSDALADPYGNRVTIVVIFSASRSWSAPLVQRVSSGQRFNFKTWDGQAEDYILSVVGGVVQGSATGRIY